MKLSLVLLFLFLHHYIVVAQKTIHYQFVVKEKIFTDSTNLFYAGAESEFSSKRTYYSDNVFEEDGLFGSNEKSVYKIQNENWHVKSPDNWKLFLSPKKYAPTKIFLGGMPYKLSFVKKDTVENLECYVFQLYPVEKSVTIGEHPYYWFNFEKGFIKLATSTTYLFRKDILENEQ